MDGTVLVADDDRTIRTVLTQALTRAGCRVHATSSLTTLLRWVEEGLGDLVVTDVVMPDGNGIEMIPRIAALRPGLPVIVISARNTIMTAIEASEAKAWDYLPKPFDLPDLLARAARAMGRAGAPAAATSAAAGPARAAAAPLSGIKDDALPLVGRTPAMQALYGLVARVVNADLPLLIIGESGAGKTALARAIHDLSARRAQPLVSVGADDLDAPGAAAGVLARAGGGTLILEEIADFPPHAQAHAVRLFEGAAGRAPRIVATTRADAAARMQAGALRDDLYYRLGGVVLAMPPLRERVDDIALLAAHFLARAAHEGAALRYLSDDALALVRAYTWPGNVRQIEHAMRRLALTGTDPEIGHTEIAPVLGAMPAGAPLRDGDGGGGGRDGGGDDRMAASVARHLRRHFDLHGGALPPPGLYGRILREIEAPLIEIALEATGGNQARCADLLGINRNTLRKKITELDIRVTRRRKLM